MSTAITQHATSRPTRSRTETKAAITDQTARAIIGAEAERREAKTARLRQARLEMEARMAAATPSAEPPRAKAATRRRVKSSS